MIRDLGVLGEQRPVKIGGDDVFLEVALALASEAVAVAEKHGAEGRSNVFGHAAVVLKADDLVLSAADLGLDNDVPYAAL